MAGDVHHHQQREIRQWLLLRIWPDVLHEESWSLTRSNPYSQIVCVPWHLSLRLEEETWNVVAQFWSCPLERLVESPLEIVDPFLLRCCRGGLRSRAGDQFVALT